MLGGLKKLILAMTPKKRVVKRKTVKKTVKKVGGKKKVPKRK